MAEEKSALDKVTDWLCSKFDVACEKPADEPAKKRGPEDAYNVSQKIPEGLGVNEAADTLHNRQAQLNKQMNDLGI